MHDLLQHRGNGRRVVSEDVLLPFCGQAHVLLLLVEEDEPAGDVEEGVVQEVLVIVLGQVGGVPGFELGHGLELLGNDLVVGADGNGGEVDVPDGVVGALNGGEGGVVLPLVEDGHDQVDGQHNAAGAQDDPEKSELDRLGLRIIIAMYEFITFLSQASPPGTCT